MIIDFINTGGTINSKASEHSLAVEAFSAESHQQAALSNTPLGEVLNKLEQELNFKAQIHTPWQKNSEDVKLADWQQLLNCLIQCNNSNSDAILVSHGTDSMVYSLALAACFDNFWRKPLCFTGAFISPALPGSDAGLNLKAALLYLKQQVSIPQNSHHLCQLAFQASGQQVDIMPASWVLPLRSHDRYFQSAYQQLTASFSNTTQNIKLHSGKIKAYPKLQEPNVPELAQLQSANSRIMYCLYYPGLCLDTLKQSTQGVDILIIEVFHSGTASFSGSNSLSEFIKHFPGLVILSSLPSLYIQKPYESSLVLANVGACLIKDLAGHYLYIYCLLRLAQNPVLDNGAIRSELSTWATLECMITPAK